MWNFQLHIKNTLGPAILSTIERCPRSSRRSKNVLLLWEIITFFLERLSSSQRVLYQRFHYIVYLATFEHQPSLLTDDLGIMAFLRSVPFMNLFSRVPSWGFHYITTRWETQSPAMDPLGRRHALDKGIWIFIIYRGLCLE